MNKWKTLIGLKRTDRLLYTGMRNMDTIPITFEKKVAEYLEYNLIMEKNKNKTTQKAKAKQSICNGNA